MEASKKNKRHYAWVVTIVCCFILFTTGCFYLTVGVFLPEIAGSARLGVTITAVSFVFSVINGLQTLAGPLAALIFNKLGIRKSAFLGLILQIASLIIFATANSYALLVLAGIMSGFYGALFIYMLVPVVIKTWFECSVSHVISIVMTFFAVGGVFYSQVAQKIIEKSSYSTAYLVLALIVALVTLPITAIFLKNRPEDVGEEKLVIKSKKTEIQKRVMGGEGLTVKSAWVSPTIILTVAALLCLQFPVAFQAHIKNFAVNVGYSAALGAMLATLCSLGGIPSKLSVGYVNEKIGPENSIIIYTGLGIVGMMLFLLHSSELMMYVGALCFGFAAQSTLVQTPTICMQVFGKAEDYTKIYGNVLFLIGAISLWFTTLIGYMYDSTGSYRSTIVSMLISFAAAIVLTNILIRRKAKE